MEEILIAPCGINCRVCGMYQKRSHPCLGCRLRTTKKSHLCVIKNCPGGTLEQPLSVPWVRQVPLSPTEGAGPAVPGKDGEGAQCGGKPAGHSGKGNGSIFT